jgi:hypothetical protein
MDAQKYLTDVVLIQKQPVTFKLLSRKLSITNHESRNEIKVFVDKNIDKVSPVFIITTPTETGGFHIYLDQSLEISSLDPKCKYMYFAVSPSKLHNFHSLVLIDKHVLLEDKSSSRKYLLFLIGRMFQTLINSSVIIGTKQSDKVIIKPASNSFKSKEAKTEQTSNKIDTNIKKPAKNMQSFFTAKSSKKSKINGDSNVKSVYPASKSSFTATIHIENDMDDEIIETSKKSLEESIDKTNNMTSKTNEIKSSDDSIDIPTSRDIRSFFLGNPKECSIILNNCSKY